MAFPILNNSGSYQQETLFPQQEITPSTPYNNNEYYLDLYSSHSCNEDEDFEDLGYGGFDLVEENDF